MANTPEVRPPAQPISVNVIEAIAEYEDVPPDELQPPLFKVIDSEALDRLFAPTPRGGTRTQGRVMFTYNDYQVTVTSEGDVSIQDPP